MQGRVGSGLSACKHEVRGNPALRIAGIYAIVGGLWILTGGWIANRLAGGSQQLLAQIESVKGYFYIGATAALLYVLVAMLMRRIRAHEAELREAAEREGLLLDELDHRVKNSLAGLLSMIDMCSDEYKDVQTFAQAIRRRVQGMSDVHNLLAEGHWSAIDLHRLLGIMSPPGAPGKVAIEGTPVKVPPRQATALGMIVQELMSNALKHGALGDAQGRLAVSWKVIEPQGSERVLNLKWDESVDRELAPEGPAGLGTRLIKGFAKSELRGSVDLSFPPKGARHSLRMRLDEEVEAV